MHVLAGLKKGDSISISRESLPGAVLFPGIKYKEFKEKEAEPISAVKEEVVPEVNADGESGVKDASISEGDDEDNGTKEHPSDSSVSVPASPVRNTEPPAPTQVHRFLVVTRERFIVLDSGGSGIGSTAIVKSNHHLTEVRAVSDTDICAVLCFTILYYRTLYFTVLYYTKVLYTTLL